MFAYYLPSELEKDLSKIKAADDLADAEDLRSCEAKRKPKQMRLFCPPYHR